MSVALSGITAGRAVVVGLLFLFLFLTGLWLSQAGKPYGAVLFTIHKLIAVGALVFLAAAVYQTNQVARLSSMELALVAASSLLFLGTIISGALLSTDLRLPAAVLTVHQIAPVLTVLSTAGTLYPLLNRVQ